MMPDRAKSCVDTYAQKASGTPSGQKIIQAEEFGKNTYIIYI